MKKRTILDFSGYQATDLEMAISLGVAHDLLQRIDPRNMTSDIFFGCSNAEILRLADEENVKAGKNVCAIVNIIQIDE